MSGSDDRREGDQYNGREKPVEAEDCVVYVDSPSLDDPFEA